MRRLFGCVKGNNRTAGCSLPYGVYVQPRYGFRGRRILYGAVPRCFAVYILSLF